MTIRVTTAAAMLAAIKARQHVKAELQRQGLKVSHYSAREITAFAQRWFEAHGAELRDECLVQAETMILSGVFGKRAQAQLVTEYRKERTVAQLSNAEVQQIAAEAQR